PVLFRCGLACPFVTDLMAAQAVVLEVLALGLALELQTLELRAPRQAVGQFIRRGQPPHRECRVRAALRLQVDRLLRVGEARRAGAQRQFSLERGIEMKTSLVVAVYGLRVEGISPNERDQRSGQRRVVAIHDVPVYAGGENRLRGEQRADDHSPL